MSLSEKINILLEKRKLSQNVLADSLSMSIESFNNKLHWGSFNFEEMEKIATKFNSKYRVVEWFELNDTGEEI